MNGNWPSKEDLASVSPSKVSSAESNKSDSQKRAPSSGGEKTAKIDEEPIGRAGASSHVSNAERNTPSQFYSSAAANNDDVTAGSRSRLRMTSDDVSSRSSRASVDSRDRPARALYDNYSDQCQELQRNYRSLKNHAEEAISQLIDSFSRPLKSDTNDDLRETLKQVQRYDASARHSTGRVGELEFGTPKRFGSSRLSLEMSLNDTARNKSLNDTRKSATSQHDNDTGVQSLNSTGKSSSEASGTTHEFLKYHTPAGVERPNGYRGPEYWSTKVKSNYEDLSQAPPPPVRLSRDNEEQLLEQLRQAREVKSSTERYGYFYQMCLLIYYINCNL